MNTLKKRLWLCPECGSKCLSEKTLFREPTPFTRYDLIHRTEFKDGECNICKKISMLRLCEMNDAYDKIINAPNVE